MATQPTTAIAPAHGNGGNLGELQKLLETHKQQIAMALPRHMTPERMIRVAMTAVSTTPALHKCTSVSIAACIVQASILGLEPTSVLGEAYLVPFYNSKAKRHDCQLIVGYQGLLKLVRQSGELVMVNAQAVRQNDEFDFEDGLDPYLRHKRGQGSTEQRGPIIGYWAGALLKGGGKQFTVMTQEEIIAHRNKYSEGWRALGEKSTWGKEHEAMALKTVLRKLCKLLPKSIERDLVTPAIGMDERAESGLAQRFTHDVPLALQAPVVDDEETVVEMPKRASTVAAESGLAQEVGDPIEQQRENIRKKLLAAPRVKELPDAMEHNIGDIVRNADGFWTPNRERSAWERYPVPEGVTVE